MMWGCPRLIGTRLCNNRLLIPQSRSGVPLLRPRSLSTLSSARLIPRTPKFLWLSSFNSNRYASLEGGNTAKSKSTTEEDLDAPIQYTTSKASTWTAAETHFLKVAEDMPNVQPFIVVFSVGCLLLWFGIFRGENDIDEEMSKPLWERIKGLEKTQIEMLIKYNLERGITTIELEERLAEITASNKKDGK